MGEIIEELDEENEHRKDKTTLEIMEKIEKKTKLTEICKKGDRVSRRKLKLSKNTGKLITEKTIMKSICKQKFCFS